MIQREGLLALISDKKASAQLVDVREPGEFRQEHIRGFRNIPLGQLSNRLEELRKDEPVVVMCRSGMRSRQAARILAKCGFQDVRNLAGGIMAWNSRRKG